MRDVVLCCPCKDQGNHSRLSPLPRSPNPLSCLCHIPWDWSRSGAGARRLSTPVSALLRSSCRAERRSPDTRTSRPTGTGRLLAHPVPASSPAPDAVPDPAAAADHACRSPAAHCCRRYCPHPQAGYPPTDHRPACGLRAEPRNCKLTRDGPNLGPRVETGPSHRGGRRWRTNPLNTALFQHISRDGSL